MAENDFATGYAVGRDAQNGGYYYPMWGMPYAGGFGGGMFGGWGGNDLIALVVILALFGGGFGGFGGFGHGTSGLATQADLSAGFASNATLNGINDIKLGQQQAINYNNQGFSGLNTSILQGFHSVDNALCTLGYQTQNGFNGLSKQISDCCCDVKSILLENRYLNERQTCDLLRGQENSTRQILDFLTGEKIDSLNRKLAVAEGQISDMRNANYIISQVKEPCPIPSYLVPNPNCCYNYGVGYSFGGVPFGTGTCTSIQ